MKRKSYRDQIVSGTNWDDDVGQRDSLSVKENALAYSTKPSLSILIVVNVIASDRRDNNNNNNIDDIS